MKKNFKKVIGLLSGLTLFATSVAVPVSASVGAITGQKYSDVVITSVASKEIKGIQTNCGDFQVAATQNDEAWGAISFDVKSDAANTPGTDGAVFIFRAFEKDAEGKDVGKNSFHALALSKLGYIGMTDEQAYGAGKNLDKGVQYSNDVWYNIGLVFNKNNTVDLYIDGAFQKSIQGTAGTEYGADTAFIRVLVNSLEGEKSGKYYLRDVKWSKYAEDTFFGIENKTTASGGESIDVTYTEKITKLDSSKIKLFNCATGAEVDGVSAAADGNKLTVNLPAGVEQGYEYRIETEGVTGTFGRTPYNDNIYFNSVKPTSDSVETIVYETFEGYTESLGNAEDIAANNEYFNPEGWALKQRWKNLPGAFIKPESDSEASHGTVADIGTTRTEVNYTAAAMYLPLNQKISSGKVILSYDVKPKKTSSGGAYSGSPSLMFNIYPEALTAEQTAYVSPGGSSYIGVENKDGKTISRTISGIVKNSVGSIKNGAVTANAESVWEKLQDLGTVGVIENPKWYNVKTEIDFNTDTITWYIDGVNKTSLPFSATFGINSIAGISFGVSDGALDSSALIDNVKVEKTVSNSLGSETTLVDDNFDAFTNTEGGGQKLWSAVEGTTVADGYIPKDWAMHRIWTAANQHYGTKVGSDNGGKSGNALMIGKQLIDDKSRYEAPVVYHKLDKVYKSGVFNVSYDVKAVKLSSDSEMVSAAETAGITPSSWGLGSVPTAAPKQFYFSVTPDSINDTGLSGNVNSVANWQGTNHNKPIFGIQNQKFASYTTPIFDLNADGSSADYTKYYYTINGVKYQIGANYRKDVNIGDWYSIRHTIDLDNKVVNTYMDDVLISAASTDSLGITSIGGITLGMGENAYNSELLIDNVKVTAQAYEKSNGGVMQVRFSDYYNNTYGAATTLTTLADAIGVAFWANTVDEPTEANFKLEDKSGNRIAFDGVFDSDKSVYLMNLKEYLTKDTEYILTVSGLTSDGVALPTYTQKIMSEQNGELIIEPITTWKNAAGTENPVLADSGTLAQGDTVIAKTRVINTTGEEKAFALSMGLFEGNNLLRFDFREVSLDGRSDAANKDANLLCSFKMSEQDAASFTKAKAFLWDSITSMKPVTPSKAFNKTTE